MLLARAGATVLCGGGRGVMAAVAQGASAENGLVIGVRPDTDPAEICEGLSTRQSSSSSRCWGSNWSRMCRH
ncbi:SLOG cluster 4 domain-containing protein [Nocardia grenadensis]|uniref:SLOG cluster 4 domain-containing protein n=1 Tax=Nocardia grenadensis TaxID=931537 RepID=UPI003D7279F3